MGGTDWIKKDLDAWRNTGTWRERQIMFEKGSQTVMGQAGSQEKEERQTWTWAGRGLSTVWMGWMPTWDTLINTMNFHVFFYPLFVDQTQYRLEWYDLICSHVFLKYTCVLLIYWRVFFPAISNWVLLLHTPLSKTLEERCILEWRIFQMLVKIIQCMN